MKATSKNKKVLCKSALVKCGIPGIDYVINPYIGCRFGCTYCYASFIARFQKDVDIKDWGAFVFPKINIVEVLQKEVSSKLKNKGRGKEVFLSSVTDPYQGLEAKYKLTRGCLEVLADHGFEGILSILTKSHLVTGDICVLKKFKRAVVGMTVTSTNDDISKYFEKNAPSVTDRFAALKKLNKSGIKTYAFIGPLLPHFVVQPKELEKVFKKLVKVGTKDIYIEHLNLSPYIRTRLINEMKDVEPDIIELFYESQSKKYREDLEEIIRGFVKKYDMNLMLDLVIFHQDFQRSGR